MQDRDSPPEAEGDTSGAVGGVRQNEAQAAPWAEYAKTNKESLPLPWITATAPTWVAIMATAAPEEDPVGLVFRPPIRCSILSPCPLRERMRLRVFAFVEDLFFLSKIQATGQKMNVKVEFVKNEKELTERMKSNGEEKPSLIIFDLNNANAKPLTLIPKLKSKLKKGTSIIGFLSHVQGDLKQKAHDVGCDMVLPRSAFSQNLPQLLRRHGAIDVESGAAD
jgi:CheY-like chemotaxis protein